MDPENWSNGNLKDKDKQSDICEDFVKYCCCKYFLEFLLANANNLVKKIAEPSIRNVTTSIEFSRVRE